MRLPSGGLLHFGVALSASRIQTRGMLRRTVVVLIAVGCAGALAGCTIYPEKRPPTLATTTSAEQYERLYWKAVQQGKWQQVVALQGPSVLYTTRDGEHVTGERWLELLRQRHTAEYLIGAVQLHPQGQDTVVSYIASVTIEKSAAPTDIAVISVWQQVRGGLILVAHSETPRSSPAR